MSETIIVYTKKPMSHAQAAAMKVVRQGGVLFQYRRKSGKYCYRLLDVKRSPVSNIQSRTCQALISSERVIKADDGTYIANPRKRNSLPKNQD